MFTNVNFSAPLGALALVATGLVILLFVLLILYALFRKKFELARWGLIGVAAVTVIYLFLLLTLSFKSSQQVLARGQEKHFCEIDCHLAYSIVDVQETKTVGDAPNQITAAGTFRLITIKTRFDEGTISPHRGNQPLYPNSRELSIMDESGNTYYPSAPAQQLLEGAHAAGIPMTTPIRPAEAYTTTVAFDLPADAKNPRLLIREGETLTHFEIGHENSPLHKKTFLNLGPARAQIGRVYRLMRMFYRSTGKHRAHVVVHTHETWIATFSSLRTKSKNDYNEVNFS